MQKLGQINRQFTHLARQAATGISHHQALHVEQFVAALTADQHAPAPAPTTEPAMWDWAAANQRKKDAVQQLAPLADALDDIEARIDALLQRTRNLKLD